MQYLSKAYNYYSGINPATLSGAIDIIVVRSVDENGEENLAGSPFHVRFGKLQVLRAGEKRVTLRLPNNLPPPHIAPFSMKVGDTGEAFFVLETEEEVPLELMTSPVVAAADAGEVPLEEESPPPEGGEQSLTQQPFGATEHQVSHEGHNDGQKTAALPEVEPLDLNTPEAEAPRKSSATKSDKLAPGDDDSNRRRSSSDSRRPEDVKPPPNPLEAEEGEEVDLPMRNYHLKHAAPREDGTVDLPKVEKGKYDGPDVTYGRDIVLDMMGFHTGDDDGNPYDDKDHPKPPTGVKSTPDSPLLRAARAKSEVPIPDVKGASTIKDDHVEEFVNDLMASSPGKKHDLPSSMAALSLEDGNKSSPTTPSPKKGRAFDRAQTEPPEDSRPSSPTNGDKVDSPSMDLAWDWSQYKGEEADEAIDGRPPPHRGESLPIGIEAGMQHPPLATLKAIGDDPYTFMLQLDGRVHLFELSLCGHEDFAPNGKASANERTSFYENRVTFQKFIEDPAIVDDPHLIIRYKGLYLSWDTGYHLLLALALYRRSMTQQPKPQQPQPQRPGYWARWWRRAEPSAPGLSMERVQSAPPVEKGDADKDKGKADKEKVEKDKADKDKSTKEQETGKDEKEANGKAAEANGSALEILDTRTASPGTTTPAEAEQEEKHYAKTLRLSSEQLKELNLKPGPNTVQFSVMSSYSGYAVVSARIFLWEDTDQVIISDIDGTITKSDALGHLYAAIGRDWTHGGIAKLYTDIANNGYKILYLTARAIGQAETTRDYLKTIVQGDYRMPEGPVIMSPDRLMASLHREVILRKPELFKMACLRDIQRLFGKHAKDAFFAGFGNRITDAMSYRSVGMETGKIYTIDSNGVIKTELLQSAHKGSYVGLNDLVNEVFPPVKTKFQPEYTDFNYWKAPIPDIPLPDFTPPSPALSARSDASGGSRLSVLGRIAGLGVRRGSRSPPPEAASPQSNATQTSRPVSPLLGPSITADDLSDGDDDDDERRRRGSASMPGSFDNGDAFPDDWFSRDSRRKQNGNANGDDGASDYDEQHEQDLADYEQEDDDMFDDDILATGEMANVPF